MSKRSLNIEGMSCQSCVMRVTKAMINVPGVSNVNVSLSRQKAIFELDESLTPLETVITAIKKAGYHTDRRFVFDWFYVWGLLILLLLLVISKHYLKLIPAVNMETDYPIIFFIGVLTSFHCIGMCGGISLGQVSSGINFSNRAFNLLQYHFGRVFSYTAAGVILGSLGSVVSPTDKLRGIVILIAASGMIIFALRGILPRWFGWIHVPGITGGMRYRIEGVLERRSWWIGVINGFIPCGPLQGLQLFALASGSGFRGGIAMFLFAVGTVPLLYGFGNAASLLSTKFRLRLVKLGLLFVLLLGVMMIMRGINTLN